MTVSQFWIYMFAILISPLIAVQVTEHLQKHKEARGRRLWIFKTLMATRASRLSLDHVQALNMIDFEFRGMGRRGRPVLESWKAYLHHLNTQMPPDIWVSRGDDLLVDLLFAMACSLGYQMNKTDIRSTSYFPTGHGRIESENGRIRTGLLELLDGARALRIRQADASEQRDIEPDPEPKADA
jgi:hypothetical protein